MHQRRQAAAHAGRGVLWISAAKLYFIVAGYAVALLLPRLLGGSEAFGLFAAAMNVAAIINNVLIAATIQTVSRQVSAQAETGDPSTSADAGSDVSATTLRQGLKLQLMLGGGLGGALFMGADQVASQWLLDPALAPLLRACAAVIFSYALYATLIGALNGRQQFRAQAGLDMLFTTLRTVGLLGAAWLGFGPLGSMLGFAGAAVALLLVSLVLVGVGLPGGRPAWRPWLVLMAPLWLYHMCLNGTLQIDLAVLKRTVAELEIGAGVAPLLAAERASEYAGLYRAAQTFAFVPYQIILAVTFVVFPMVSQAASLGDREAARRTIRNAMRFSLLVLLAVAAPISGAARGVMRIAYPEAFLPGSDALVVLAPAMVCLALFVIGATALSGSGRPALAALIAGSAMLIVVLASRTLLTVAGVGEGTLTAVATGTALGTGFALGAVGIVCYLRFGAFIPLMSAVRGLVAAGAGYATAHGLPHDTPLGALAALVGGGLMYLLSLALLREVGRADLDMLRSILGRRRSAHAATEIS